MPAPRRPAAPRPGAADDGSRGEDDRAARPVPARRGAPRTAGVPRSPAPRTAATPATRGGAVPATRGGATPATRGGAAPATRDGASPAGRSGAPQQSVLRPATPRPAASRARATPSAPPRASAARPSSSRPGGRGTGDRRPGRAETVQQRVPRLFTVRALVMFVVLSIAFVLVFPTLRQYLDQQVQLEQLRAEVAQAEQDNEDLQAELDRWSDPAYVEAQARERLAFVMPGERALRVADPEVVPEQPAPEGPAVPAAVEPDDPTRPWYAQLWDSVQVAGVAGTGSTEPAPAGENGSAPAEPDATAPADGAPATP